MSKLKVTFDSDVNAKAFAHKWKLSAPEGDSLDIEWHLAEDAIKDQTCSLEQKDEDEHEFIVKGQKNTIESCEDTTVEEDLGNGFFRVKSSKGLALGEAVEGIDHSDSPVEFLSTSSISEMNTTDTDLNPTDAEGQWPRLRVASTYRPLVTSYQMMDTNFVSKPELYIMDTGIDSTHAEFQGEDLEIDTFWCLDGIWEDGDQKGHGTGVASMAVGTNLGISDNVKLRIIKIAGNKINEDGNLIDPGVSKQASVLELGRALDALEAEVVANPNKTRILNVSWGVARSAYLDAKFESLMSAGVTVIAAAGNSGIDVELVTPAGINGCLTIGATDKYDIPAGFNNISPSDEGLTTGAGLSLDLFAPGESVMIAHTIGAGAPYGITSGTSLSAPIVAGIAGVIGSMNDDMVSAQAMKEMILGTATENALLFEDSTFTEEQNKLAHVFTADPLATYKDADMVSYLGVANANDGDAIVIDLNSTLDLSKWKKLYPNDEFTYSIEFLDESIKAKYNEYIDVDSVSGSVRIETAKGVLLPADTALEMVEFKALATSVKAKVESNTIFYFHSNSWSDQSAYDTLEADVTLALTDVNSISFFIAWGGSIK